MIKINLLAEGKRPVVARKSKSSLGGVGSGPRDMGNLLLVAGVVLGLLAAGGWFFWVQSRLKQKEKEVVQAQREIEELKQVIRSREYKIKKPGPRAQDRCHQRSEGKSARTGPDHGSSLARCRSCSGWAAWM
jgi:hypothetical protein